MHAYRLLVFLIVMYLLKSTSQLLHDGDILHHIHIHSEVYCSTCYQSISSHTAKSTSVQYMCLWKFTIVLFALYIAERLRHSFCVSHRGGSTDCLVFIDPAWFARRWRREVKLYYDPWSCNIYDSTSYSRKDIDAAAYQAVKLLREHIILGNISLV